MTPITIAGKEYPWPEGCPAFFIIERDAKGRDGFWFSPIEYYRDVKHWSHDENWPYRVGDETPGGILPIIAAVAARHFRNVQRRTGMEINALDKDKHFGPYGISTHARELVDKQADVGKAAEQWEQLCHDL